MYNISQSILQKSHSQVEIILSSPLGSEVGEIWGIYSPPIPHLPPLHHPTLSRMSASRWAVPPIPTVMIYLWNYLHLSHPMKFVNMGIKRIISIRHVEVRTLKSFPRKNIREKIQTTKITTFPLYFWLKSFVELICN